MAVRVLDVLHIKDNHNELIILKVPQMWLQLSSQRAAATSFPRISPRERQPEA